MAVARINGVTIATRQYALYDERSNGGSPRNIAPSFDFVAAILLKNQYGIPNIAANAINNLRKIVTFSRSQWEGKLGASRKYARAMTNAIAVMTAMTIANESISPKNRSIRTPRTMPSAISIISNAYPL